MDNSNLKTLIAEDFANDELFSLSSANITISEQALDGVIRIQGPGGCSEFRTKIESLLGLALPEPCTVSRGEKQAIVWITPNEWTLLCNLKDENYFYQLLCLELTSFHAYVTIVSDSRLKISLDGINVRDVLSKACALDFYPNKFLVNDCAITVFAGIPALVIRRTDDNYILYIERPLKTYILNWLKDAASEYK
jgi:sarcosine oxidase subunit gamma